VEKVDIIWNITRVCPWDCAQCCVDAYHVTRNGEGVGIRHSGLAETITLKDAGPRQIFDAAAAEMVRRGLELSLADKLRVVDALAGYDAEIDFSGGDPLVVSENLEVIRHASGKFGRENVSVTATGPGMAHYRVDELAPYIHMIEFTYDHPGARDDSGRPRGYNGSNLRKAREFKRHGCASKAQTPLTPANMDPALFTRVYLDLHEAEIDSMLLMRTFPVGRAAGPDRRRVPSRDDYRRVIALARELEAKHGAPRVRLQCALKHVEPGRTGGENPCDLLHESLGITNDGKLQLSAWAWDGRGRPLPEWIIGDLTRETMEDILTSPRVAAIRARLDENFGHCKIFAYMFSSGRGLESLFEPGDPLYADADGARGASR
jgi:MoaA/NifB/PqqE/SkfB family radical SAM enzyme